LSLRTESWGHEYSRRASVRVPISQLRYDARSEREREVAGDWAGHVPPFRNRDRVGPSLGEGSLVDESTGVWYAYDSGKQGNDHEGYVPHSVQRSG